MKFINKIRNNKKGATAIEYALIAALVAIAAITAMGTVGKNINAKMKIIGSNLGSSASAPSSK